MFDKEKLRLCLAFTVYNKSYLLLIIPPAIASGYLPLTYAVFIHNNSQKLSSLSFLSFLTIYIESLLDLNLQTFW